MRHISFGRKIKNGLVATLFAATQVIFPVVASHVAYASAAANLDQWASGGTSSGSGWQNGDLNSSNSTIHEGDSVPFRTTMSGLTSGSHTLVISYKNVDSSKHAYDYLTSFDRTFTPNPCDSVLGACTQGTPMAIPADPTLANPPGPVTPAPGQFKIFGATSTTTAVTNVSYTSTPGHSLSGGNLFTTISVTFSTDTPTVVLAWGGHVASEADWGVGTGASAISGSPYHMLLGTLDGASTGSQDRAMKASAVILFPDLTITKVVQSGTANPWDFTFNVTPAIAGHPNPIIIPTGQSSVTIPSVQPDGNYTITENSVTGYAFVTGSGTSCSFNGSTATATLTSGTSGNVVNASCTFTNGQLPSSITLIKTVNNTHGGTAGPNDFGLSIGGNSVTSGQKVSLAPGSYAINEAGKTGYQFVSLTGTGCPTQLGGNVNLAAGQNITCTITNADIAPTLTLVKTVVNNNGGSATTANFQGKIDGNNVAWQVAVPVSAGAHNASEAAILPGGAGYAASTWSGDCAANGSVTLNLAQNATCYITNDDIAPSLTLNKIVSNTHGGTAVPSNWTLTATGPTTLSGPGPSVASGATFAAGTYTLSESGGPSGYSASSWTCTNNVTVSNGHITLANGQTTSCTITNSDVAPIITIIKQVLNPYGTPLPVSSFPLFVDGQSVTSGVANTQFAAGSHTVTETQQSGYQFTSFTGQNCTLAGGIMTAVGIIGGTTTCTITNTAIQPKLTVIKHVINDNGGIKSASDFTMTVTGNSQTVPNFPGSETGTTVGLNEGPYSVNELSAPGYTQSLSGDCSGTIHVGDVKTCTITNNDIAPSLTLTKIVSNTHGGTALASNWTLTATGPTTLSGPGPTVASGSNFAAGTYALSESGGPSGYSASDWTCTNNVTVTNSQISLANGQTTACTITNSDIAPVLTIIKQVLNPYGTPLPVSSFPLFVDGQSVTSGVANTQFNAGTHTVTETQQYGYQFTSFNGQNCTLTSGVMTALGVIGGTTTCTITNTAIQPKLTVIKHVINDNSGTKSASDFTMTVTGNSQTIPSFPGSETGTTVGLNEGPYSVNELPDAGYTQSLSGDCSGTIHVGDTKTCTITNDDVAHPAITIVKDGPATAHEGDTVTYTFKVTNTGDTATLGNIVVTDTIGNQTLPATYQSGDTNNDGLLQKSETWHYTLTYTIPVNTKSVFNTGQACGDDPAQTKVCSTDTHTLTVLHPSIYVVKSGPATGSRGDTVTYTFSVTINKPGQNGPGDTPLTITQVNDNIAGSGTYVSGDTNNNGLLDLNETWIYTANYTIPATQNENVVNTVTVCGQDSLQAETEADVCSTSTHTLVLLAPVLNITKSNNRPNPTTDGDTVTYTLVVTVPQDSGKVFGAKVVDLPPKGFTYIHGSWTANSSIRGNIKGTVTTEPTYGSPGTWLLGDLLPGEVVTLTYQTLIQSTVSDGTYPDIAFANGCASPVDSETTCPEGNAVFANVQLSQDNPFVGTNVTVSAPVVIPPPVTVLVNTGASNVWLNALAAITLAGAALITLVRREQKGAK